MRSRRLPAVLAALGALAISACAAGAGGAQEAPYRPGVARIPVSEKPFAGTTREFRFAIMGDRTGRPRPGVFERALKQAAALRPDFILSIGDLIEGNSEDGTRIAAEWDAIQGAIEDIDVPFFYVPGNHDLTNDMMRAEWRRRLGADYYHFLYKDVLFLVLNTEDPPQPAIARGPLLQQYGPDAMRRTLTALQGDAAGAEALFAAEPRLAELAAKLRASEQVAFSVKQLDMVRRALAAHPNARWTFVLMHRPAWKVDSAAYREIETMLRGRPHTVLAGHYHRYEHVERDGVDHIQLGVTGGMPGDAAQVDQFMWVAMSDAGPSISNLALHGISDKRGSTPTTSPQKGIDE